MSEIAPLVPAARQKLLTAREVADWLGVSVGWVHDHASGRRQPVLPSVVVSPRCRRFRDDGVNGFLLEGERLSRSSRMSGTPRRDVARGLSCTGAPVLASSRGSRLVSGNHCIWHDPNDAPDKPVACNKADHGLQRDGGVAMAERLVVNFDVRSIGRHMPRSRYQRGTLRTSVPAHAGRPERRLPRGEYWCQWFRYVRMPDGKELRRKREKIISRDLAESHHIATDYSGPLTKSDAQRVLDLLIAQDAGTYVAPDTAATFEQVAREYIELNKPRWGEDMLRTAPNTIAVHLIGKLGKRSIGDLDALELQRFLNSYISSDASKSLLSKLLLHLRGILDHAVSRRIILANPARDPGQKLRAKSRHKGSDRALSVEETQRLIAAVTGRDRLIFRMFFQLSLRPEELFSLRPEDAHDGQVWISDSKTDASDAPVHIPGDLLVDLQNWIGNCKGPWIFTGPRGGKIHHHNYLNRVLKPAARRAGVDGVNFQVLRRTSGTLFGDLARDPRLTQAQLRHADPQVTLKHYQQPIQESLKDVAEKLERLLEFGVPAKKPTVN